jgi:hypothetical protein
MASESFVTDPIAMHAAAIVLAMCGGSVRFFQAKAEKTLLQFFVSLLSSAFSGELLACFTSTFDLAMGFRIGLIGLAGYGAADILPLMSKILQTRISGYTRVGEVEKTNQDGK